METYTEEFDGMQYTYTSSQEAIRLVVKNERVIFIFSGDGITQTPDDLYVFNPNDWEGVETLINTNNWQLRTSVENYLAERGIVIGEEEEGGE
jgi:hypothetical protein